MISMFIFGLAGGLTAAYFAFPYGWFAAIAAYALGGAICALIPALIEWRQEVVRERDAAATQRESSKTIPAPEKHAHPD